MPRDARLQLSNYFDGTFERKVKLNYDDLFRVRTDAEGKTQYPFDPGHFTAEDFINRVEAKKRILNPRLGALNPEDPQATKVFTNLDRFRPSEMYDFANGKMNIQEPFTAKPDFNPVWAEKFKLSPIRPPDKDPKNTFPSAVNPDPLGYIFARAAKQAEDDVNGDPSVAELLQGQNNKPEEKKKEEQEGTQVINKEEKTA